MKGSIWKTELNDDKVNRLNRDLTREVVIIGAGLAGVLTGYFLKQAGVQVTIIEADHIGHGVTMNTTGKITMGLPEFFAPLLKNYGKEKSKIYTDAMQKAVHDYDLLIRELNIPCDYEQLSSFIYSTKEVNQLEQEWKSAQILDIGVKFATASSLPFHITDMLEFPKQGQFHPIKFLEFMAMDLEIFEESPVEKVEGNVVHTSLANITADYIITTTHYPFEKWKGGYYLRNHQEGSRVVVVSQIPELMGMYIDEKKGGYSLRNYKDYMLVGSLEQRYDDKLFGTSYHKIKSDILSWYPHSVFETQWSNQDCVTLDSLPYIGKVNSKSSNYLTATGFGKWGMIGSMIAASLLKDMILKNHNQLELLVTPQRFSFSQSTGKFTKQTKISCKNLIKSYVSIPKIHYEDIELGKGGIIEFQGNKVGIYRDKNGEDYFVDVKCPHLGCQLIWNQEDYSWDCPCHGSRFDYKGNIINNPAMKSIRDHVEKI